MTHTDEKQRTFKCRLLGVDRKWLTCGQNDANDPSGHRRSLRSVYQFRSVRTVAIGMQFEPLALNVFVPLTLNRTWHR
jgi:hypothetical protein